MRVVKIIPRESSSGMFPPSDGSIWVDDREVGKGQLKDCQALADELAESECKTNLVYDLAEGDRMADGTITDND